MVSTRRLSLLARRVSAAGSEQRVLVSRLLRNPLKHIPVFHDPTLLVESEDVDPCPIAIARALLVAVQHHVVALRKHPLELHPLAWILDGRGALAF